MLQISLAPQNGVPLVDQIVGAIRSQIEDRVLRPGTRLPSIRQFADTQRVSRFTVVEAYDRLVAQGHLVSRRGSGFYVAPRATRPEEDSGVGPARESVVDVAWLTRQALDAGAEGLRASAGWLPMSWMDEDGLRRQMRAVMRNPQARLGAYGMPKGYQPLRQFLTRKMEENGIATTPSQIVLTHGATEALDLVVHRFVRRGDVVLVDDPGYFSLFGLLRLHGARLIGVPWTPEGPDAKILEQLAVEHKPKVYFTQSVLHNPTGASISPANAYRLLQCAERHDFHIVEDDTYCDFHPGGATRLAALDHLDRVVYISSFSKTVSGNLRVGFVAARPDIIEGLTDIKVLTLMATPEVAEETIYRMLIDGHYRKHLERLRQRLSEAGARTLRLTEHLGLQPFIAPLGGIFIWVRIPDVEDAVPLSAQAAQEGILLAPGTLFRPQGQSSPWLRLNLAYASDARLERFLMKALK